MSKLAKGKFFFGSVKVGERGQIVIPAKARKIFDINPGDQILVFGDIKKGLGLMKASRLKKFAVGLFNVFNLGDDINKEDNEGVEEDEEE